MQNLFSSVPKQNVSIIQSGKQQEKEEAPIDSAKDSDSYPENLRFLALPICNPDFSDKKARRQGFVTGSLGESVERLRDEFMLDEAVAAKAVEEVNATMANPQVDHRRSAIHKLIEPSTMHRLRTRVGKIVHSLTVQLLLYSVILLDLVVTALELILSEKARNDTTMIILRVICDYLVIIIFGAEVAARVFHEGHRFFRSFMNIFELLLVPLTVVDIFIISKSSTIPLPLLRVLRPLFRFLRVLRIIIKTLTESHRFQKNMRRRLSDNRRRFTEDGFDLDLAYIGSQTIATSVPARGIESVFRNPMHELARLLNERHTNKYILVNLTERRKYPISPFFYRYIQLSIPHHGVPSLKQIIELCKMLDAYLKLDPENVVCFHSRNGRGRVGLMISCLKMFRGEFSTAASALHYFEKCRNDDDQQSEEKSSSLGRSVDSQSQARFAEYFALLCKLKQKHGIEYVMAQLDCPRQATLRKICILGLPPALAQSAQIRCFQHQFFDGKGIQYGSDLMNDSESVLDDPTETTDLPIMSLIKAELDEARYDTIQTGGFNDLREPQFNTRTGCAKDDAVSIHEVRGEQQSSGQSETIFFVHGIHQQGEVKFEILCEATEASQPQAKPDKDNRRGCVGTISALCQALIARCKKQQRSTERHSTRRSVITAGQDADQEVKLIVKEQMILFFWIHTNFLELDRRRQASEKWAVAQDEADCQILLSYKRFELDKGAFSPKLWSYSSSFSVAVDYEAAYLDSTIDDIEPSVSRVQDVVSEMSAEDEADAISSLETLSTEKIQWMNWLIRNIWPHSEAAIRRLFEEKALPILNRAVPTMLQPVSIKAFSLGKTHPSIGPLTAAKRVRDGDEVQIDVGVNYNGELHVVLDVNGIAELGISHMRLRGTMSVMLKPFIQDIPIVGGLHCFFLNTPEIDFTFAGTLEVANMSVIHERAMDAILGALTKKLVLPNLVFVDTRLEVLKRGDQMIFFTEALPEAVVRITVVEAIGLVSSEWSIWNLTQTSDPYCTLTLGDHKVSTGIVTKTTNPTWNATFDMLLHDWNQKITVTIYDRDLARSDYLLGRAVIPCVALLQSWPDGLWVDLKDVPYKEHGKFLEVGRPASKVLLQAEACQMMKTHRSLDLVMATSREPTGTNVSETPHEDDSSESGKTSCKPSCSKVTRMTPRDHNSNKGSYPAGWIPGAGGNTACVLIFRVLAACVPEAVCDKMSDMTVQIAVGTASAERKMDEKTYPGMRGISPEVLDIIRDLPFMHLSDTEVATVVKGGIEADDEVIDKLIDMSQGFNGEIKLRRLYLFFSTEDIVRSHSKITLSVLAKGHVIAKELIPFSRFRNSTDLNVRDMFQLEIPSSGNTCLQLEVDASLRILEPFEDSKLQNLLDEVSKTSVDAPPKSAKHPFH